MASIQSQVMAALLDGSSRITRRAEIYESDGTTVFADSDNTPRIIGGSISVDMTRDERRGIDITFDNTDGLLQHDPNGFWYDKVIKVFKGTEWTVTQVSPHIGVISAGTQLTASLKSLGYTDLTTITPVRFGDVADYDIIIVDAGTGAISAANYTLITEAYNAGKCILTISDEADQSLHPLIAATTTKSDAAAWSMTPSTTDNPLARKWTTFTAGGTGTGKVISSLVSPAKALATYVWSSTTYTVAVYSTSQNGGKWIHFQEQFFTGSGYNALLNAAVGWLYMTAGTQSWETQVGEFTIDRITEPRFPRIIKCTGRDYTKRLLKSKFSEAVTFADGTDIDTLVGAIAANAGITKMNLNAAGSSLFGAMSFDRTTERWAAMKGVANASGVEVFFDARGYLTTRLMQDPSTSPSTLLLATGSEFGNLVNYEKSSGDSRLYNRVIVTSENQDSVVQNTYGLQYIAENTEPSSPTRIEKMGELDYFYTSSFFTSLDQMQWYAEALLKIVALEEYELDFEVVPFYWSEAGDIIEFADPRSGVDEPTRFLMSNFDIPLGLGTMSGNARRVTIVGKAT